MTSELKHRGREIIRETVQHMTEHWELHQWPCSEEGSAQADSDNDEMAQYFAGRTVDDAKGFWNKKISNDGPTTGNYVKELALQRIIDSVEDPTGRGYEAFLHPPVRSRPIIPKSSM